MKQPTVKTVLAIFVVFFGMAAMVFVSLEDMVLGALIGIVSSVMQYFFGSSSGSAKKDDTITDMARKENPEVGVIKEVIIENVTEAK